MEERLSPPRSNGFTLVELLVVIGVIAVLISMLLPALNRARAQARVISCASNIRQIVIAATAYATDNRGSLPPRYGAGDFPIGGAYGNASTLDAYTQMSEAAVVGPAGSYAGCNIGALMAGGYLGTVYDLGWLISNGPGGVPNLFNTAVCPVRFEPGRDPFELAAAMGGTGSGSARDFILNSSYLFNPHWAISTASAYSFPGNANFKYPLPLPVPPFKVSWYTKAAAFNKYKALVTDMICSPYVCAHRYNATITFNLGFIDGHVSTVNDKLFVQYQTASAGRTANPWIRWPVDATGETVTNLPADKDNGFNGGGGMDALDDDIDILEAEANGVDPATTAGDPAATLWKGNGAYVYRLQKGTGSSPSDVPADDSRPFVPWR